MWHAWFREGISSAGSCLQCQLQGAGYIWKAGPALVCVEEAFSVDLNEKRITPLAYCLCLPAVSENGGRKRKWRWKLQPTEQISSQKKLSISLYLSILLLSPATAHCSPVVLAKPCHYVPDIMWRYTLLGRKSVLLPLLFLHLPTSLMKRSKYLWLVENLFLLLGLTSALIPASQAHLWHSSGGLFQWSSLATSYKSEVNQNISHFRKGRPQCVFLSVSEISREQWDAMLSFTLFYLFPFSHLAISSWGSLAH